MGLAVALGLLDGCKPEREGEGRGKTAPAATSASPPNIILITVCTLRYDRPSREELNEELARWLEQEEALRRVVEPAGTRALTPEALEQLRSLGYIR